MKKTIYTLVPALLLAACSDDSTPSIATTGSGIVLDAQVEQATTRAGTTGTIDDEVLHTTGFGVFAYSATEDYSAKWLSNTHVTYDGGTLSEKDNVHIHPAQWNYGTTKEWPATGNISFYAYAPFVTAGDANPGITAVNTTSADEPKIEYLVPNKPSEAVDLLWGIKGTTGLPWTAANLNNTGGNVLFTFHHALAAIGFHVQAIVDQNNNLTDPDDKSTTGFLGTNCKVTIKSITLECTNGTFYDSGTLNLHNTAARTPLWESRTGTTNKTLTLDDEIDPKLLDPAPTNDSEIEGMMNDASLTGITESANTQTVIAKNDKGKEQFFMLIPDDGTKNYELTVEYYVTFKTADGHYTRLDYTGANAGKATITGMELKADTRYYMNMVIGLHSFSLNVTAIDWQDQAVPVGVTIEQASAASESLSRPLAAK